MCVKLNLFQLTTFFNNDCTVDLVTKVLSIVLPMFVCLLKYNAFFFNAEKVSRRSLFRALSRSAELNEIARSRAQMKLLMDLMWYHWTIIRDEREAAILEKHGRFTRRFTMAMMRKSEAFPRLRSRYFRRPKSNRSQFRSEVFSSGMCVVTIGHYLPVILDMVAPLNSSRPRNFYILMEYFVDQERYFLPILLHTIVSLLVGCMVVLSAGTTFMAYMQHACAMLKIAR